jgi:hypothetical protein
VFETLVVGINVGEAGDCVFSGMEDNGCSGGVIVMVGIDTGWVDVSSAVFSRISGI